MRRITTLTLSLLLGVAVQSINAQSLPAFKDHLATPVTSSRWAGRASVDVTEVGDAAKAVAETSRNSVRARLKGYRVCIFFDNGSDARSGAVAARSLFESTFSGVKVYMAYDVPYFKVTVGNFLTNEEAIMLKSRVSASFPKAFVKNEEFSIGELLDR